MEQQSFFAKNRFFIIIGLLFFVGGGLYFFWPKSSLKVQAIPVVRGSVERVVSSSSSGEFLPRKKLLVRSEVAGRIIKLAYEKPGQQVTQGTPIIFFDSKEQSARVSQAMKEENVIGAQIAQNEVRLNNLVNQENRLKQLLTSEAATKDQMEQATFALKETQAALESVRRRKEQASLGVQLMRLGAKNYQVSAPFSGVLSDILVDEGAFVTPGTPLFEIMDTSNLYVRAFFDGTDASSLQVGQKAKLQLDDEKNQILWGTIRMIDPALKKDIKGARTCGVEIMQPNGSLPNWASVIRPLQSTTVEVVVERLDNVLVVPIDTVVGRGSDRKIYVLRKEQKDFVLHLIPVGLGLEGVDFVEVKSGLTESDLILSPKELRRKDRTWVDGMRVSILQDQTPEKL